MTRHIVRHLVRVLLAGLLVTGSFAAPISAGAFGPGPVPAGAGDQGVQLPDSPSVPGGDIVDDDGPYWLTGGSAAHSHGQHQHAPFTATVKLKRIQQTAGEIEVTATYDHGISKGFEITLPTNRNVNVRSVSGFSKQSGNTYAWDGSTSDPSVTYRLNPNMSAGPAKSAVDVGKWALVRGSYVSPRHNKNVGSNWWDAYTYKPQKGVTVGDIVYLGPYTEQYRSAPTQRFRVVVTEPAKGVPMTRAGANGLDNSVAELEDIMANVSRDFDVGERDPTVTVLIGPQQVPRAEAEDAGYLLPKKSYNGAPTFVTQTAIHEYVHTRQNFTEQTVGSNGPAGQQTAWLIEGQAQYYEHLYACREGEITNKEFIKALKRGQTTGSALADASTWSSLNVKYQKGALVLAALDNRIVRQTGGSKSLEDVFRRLNDHEGEINHTVFADTVAGVAGTRMDNFLRTYVKGTDAPSVPSRIACSPPVVSVGRPSPTGKLANLQVSDQQPRAGDRVTVVAEVKNPGKRFANTRSYTAALVVDGNVVDRKTLSVRPGWSRPVAFSRQFPTPGEREVTVGLLENGHLRAVHQPPVKVDVQPARVPVRVRPAVNTTAPDTTETYNLTVGDVPNGVGSYTVDFRVNDTAVANITGVTVLGGSGTTSITQNGKTARVNAAGLNTPDGTVPVARVTLVAKQAGDAELSATVHALGDESGNRYAVGRTDSGVLHVRPPTSSTSLEYAEPLRWLDDLDVEGLECRIPICEEFSAAGLTDDERVLLSVEGAERTHHYVARVEERVVTEFEPVDSPDAVDPTVVVRTTADAVGEFRATDDPRETFHRLFENDRITIETADR